MQSPTHILDFSLESTPQNIDMGIKWCFSQNIILTGAKLITLNEINQSQNASWHAGPDATQTHIGDWAQAPVLYWLEGKYSIVLT